MVSWRVPRNPGQDKQDKKDRKKKLERIRDCIMDWLYCDEQMDLYMMREVYHCPPSVYSEQEIATIELHKEIIKREQRRQDLDNKRSEQKRKLL